MFFKCIVQDDKEYRSVVINDKNSLSSDPCIFLKEQVTKWSPYWQDDPEQKKFVAALSSRYRLDDLEGYPQLFPEKL